MKYLVSCLATVLLFSFAARAQDPPFTETLRSPTDPHIAVYKPAAPVAGHLTSVGTDTMEKLMKLWFVGFTRFHPQTTFSMEAKNSLTAEPALTEGRADIAPLSRELMPSELDHFRKKYGYLPLMIRVGLGSYRTPSMTVALGFYVHKSNPINRLDFSQLDAIYCTGRKRGYKEDLTKWGQLGLTGEWAERPIHAYGVQWPDGISNFIRLIVCNDGELKNDIKGVKIDHSPGVPTAMFRILGEIDKDSAAIGYGGFYGEKPNTKKVAISVNPKGPYFTGSFDEVAATKYPLTRYIHIVVNKPPGKPLDPRVKEFLKYVLSQEAQQAIEKDGVFLPLPARLVKQELKKLE